MLFNQFHDLAAGSGIAVIYRDAQEDYDWVRMSTNEISAEALGAVTELIDTSGEGTPVLVYNPLGWTRSGDVIARVQVSLADAGSVPAVQDATGDSSRSSEDRREDWYRQT